MYTFKISSMILIGDREFTFLIIKKIKIWKQNICIIILYESITFKFLFQLIFEIDNVSSTKHFGIAVEISE